MKTPFNSYNDSRRNNVERFDSFDRAFDDDIFTPDGSFSSGEKEKDIREFTRQMLDENNSAAVITKDGRIVPKNRALKSGERDFTELYKERVWG